MKAPQAPKLDTRRTRDFAAELEERARAWIPSWEVTDGEGDFGRALLQIAARFNSEVAERLDRAGEKMRRGFLDWLAVRGQAARPSRMPVVFKLTDAAREAVLAEAPVRLQADAAGTPVVFETEKDVRVVPGRLEIVIGVDADEDAFYLTPPGLSDLKPLEPLPTEWRVKSFASAGVSKIQLDPEAGLLEGTVIEADGQQYQIVKSDKDLVTIQPPLTAPLEKDTRVTKVTTFSPFDGKTRNQQLHALYIGDSELLNIEAEATIEVVGATSFSEGFVWEYWGKSEDKEEVKWQRLEVIKQIQPDAIALKKPKGAIEEREINGKNSRWIRSRKTKLTVPDSTSVDEFRLRINCLGPMACPPPADATPGPTAEAMVNNTPLVLSEPFYPLGREPRQFDAFYLGSQEAFSKKGADAQVCFEMSDATCRAYAAVRTGLFANQGVLAGVGKDKALHLFKLNPTTGVMTSFRGPLRPPLPAAAGVQVTQPTPVDLNPLCRPVIWNPAANADEFFVAVAAGGEIWLWHETVDPKNSHWILHSRVPNLQNRPADIVDIIVLRSFPERPGAVLSNGRFWVFNGTEWIQPLQPPIPPGTPLRDYAALVPIYDGTLGLTDSMVAVSVSKELYRLETNGVETPLVPGVKFDVGTVPTGGIVPVGGIRPAAVGDGQLRVVAVNEARDELVAVSQGAVKQRGLLGAEAIGAEVAVSQFGGTLQFSVGAKKATDSFFVASWVPTFVAGDPSTILESPIPDATGEIGTPLFTGSYVVVPGGRGDAFVAPFNPAQRLEFTTKFIIEGVIVPTPAPFAVNDFISVMTNEAVPTRIEWTVTKAPSQNASGSEFIYLVDPALGKFLAENPRVIGYPAAGLTGTINSFTDFDPTVPDLGITPGMILRISVTGQPTAFCQVHSVDPVSGNVVVENTTQLPANNGALEYRKPIPSVARVPVLPAIEFDPLGDGNWDVTILDTANLYFPRLPLAPSFQPSPQRATAFGVVGNHPTVVALTQRWTSAPPPLNAATPFIIDAVTGAWRHQLSDTRSNPALSWEYWNGKGWWSLEIINDGTERLASTGAVTFKIPPDITESDWAGKTNFWIRVRLVGGDYGHEEVKVISKPGPNPGETEQVVERSTGNIRAPLVLDLNISYSICKELLPKFVQSQDSGTVRDQSDANRTPGALVEAFVPLAVTIGRLSKNLVSSMTPEECPPECDCPHPQPTNTEAQTDPTTTPAATSPRATGRNLFIGLNATLSEAPVNVLLLVEERNHTAFAPMEVEALIANSFKPIVVNDTTRALGESGLLSMTFAIPPTSSELFGKTLTWLRLIPKPSATEKWIPTLRGAYLNAAWASATETLTRELLGSSDGAPNLTVRLARPPVLHKTLELRVKEPLGEEEREELLKDDPDKVLQVKELPGDWVLWKQVIDPNDEPPHARVYALDETNGVIRFGDGQHGLIPPIGQDSIVAFRYSRTETGQAGSDTVPGNTIGPRTALNLVSPVETVEAVVSADQAAGGAPAELDERVLRFGFARVRHRNRAVTARDIEDIALQSSPDIVQTRAVVRRGYLKLVVVMRGKNPKPTAAQVRELRRLLLEAAPASLSAPDALRVTGPKIRRLQIELKLRVATLDHAGELGKYVREQLTRFFDTAAGGIDKDGWPLGINPIEEDIAYALINAPHLDSIADVNLWEIDDEGKVTPWTLAVKETEIVMLADDPVRIEFETAEVLV